MDMIIIAEGCWFPLNILIEVASIRIYAVCIISMPIKQPITFKTECYSFMMTFMKITHSAFKRLSLEISAVEANTPQHCTIVTFLVWHTAQGSETAVSCGR